MGITTKYLMVGLLVHLVSLDAMAQFGDDFSSGSFLSKGWQGDTAEFRFTSSSAIPEAMRPALQLFSSGVDTSMIWVTEEWQTMLEWSAWYKLSFRPTANNFARFYLTWNHDSLPGSDSSLFVGVGMSSRRVGLYRHEGSEIIPMIEDPLHPLDGTVNEIRFRVVMKNGWWWMWLDPAGGNNMELVDSCHYTFSASGVMAGIWCRYTASNATRVYVDDVYCGLHHIDTVPPKVKALWLKDPQQITIAFSEPLDPEAPKKLSSFMVGEHMMMPLLCIPDATVETLYHLHYPYPFPDGVPLWLNLTGISDKAGNVMPDTSVKFTWFTAPRNGVLINEIMARPSPTVKLPPSEYIELFNNTLHDISLCGWVLRVDDTRTPLPCRMIDGGGYYILIDESDTLLWKGYQGVITMPRLQLRNSGACIALEDFRGGLVHAVCYESGWHSTSFHEGGGWSLELKDPGNPCQQHGGWVSSKDLRGGTPGAPNSHLYPYPDLQSPRPLRISVLDEHSLLITFTEPVDTTVNPLQLFAVDGFKDPFYAMQWITPLYTQGIWHIRHKLEPYRLYHLVLTDTLRDCVGNYTTQARLPFGLPITPAQGDLLINEVMFRAGTYGTEYLELFNNSSKIIDLSACYLARYDTLTEVVEQLYPLTDEAAMIFPGEYIVITRNPHVVLSNHLQALPERVFLNSALPSLPNQGACYALIGEHGHLIETICYHPDFHAPGISDTRGIALERLSKRMDGKRADNWYSASAASGFATPTQPNSQGATPVLSSATAEVHPKWFNPHGNESQQLAFVHLNQIPAGTRASVVVTNETGRMVRTLLSESIAACGDTLPWDGTCNAGLPCPPGVYIVCVFFYHPVNGLNRHKLPLVLVRK